MELVEAAYVNVTPIGCGGPQFTARHQGGDDKLLDCSFSTQTYTQRGRSRDGFSEGGEYKFCEVILKLHSWHRLFRQYEISDMTSMDCVWSVDHGRRITALAMDI